MFRAGPSTLGVYLQNRGAAGAVGTLDHDAAVEAPWSQQRLIEHIGTIRGGQHDDPFAGIEAAHLGQDLVQGLFALVMATELGAGATRAADGVELVDEELACASGPAAAMLPSARF